MSTRASARTILIIESFELLGRFLKLIKMKNHFEEGKNGQKQIRFISLEAVLTLI